MSAAAPQPLPEPYGWGSEGLEVDGVPVADLADRFGTPLYVTAAERIRRSARTVRDAFREVWPAYRLLYAVKANNNPAIVRLLHSEGCGADCSSPDEIRIAKAVGVPSSEMLYTAAYPSDAELEVALGADVAINLDDPALLPRLLGLGRPRALSYRLNPGPTAAGREGLRFSGRRSKFGSPLARALEGYRAARRAGIDTFGAHTMPGSNVLKREHFAFVGRFLGDAARRIEAVTGTPLAFVDGGGGFGVPYTPGERPLDVPGVAKALSEGFQSRHAGRPELWNELGRYLVCDSTVLVGRVTHRKGTGPRFVGLDAGMHSLLRPALYGAYHEIYPVRRRAGPTQIVNVVGPVCEDTDVLARSRRLPPLRVGDLLAFGNTGAYGFAMSSQYNTRPRAAEVLVEGGRATLIRRRETTEDLLRTTEPEAATA